MERIPEFVKTMIGTGIGTALCGVGVWAAQLGGAPVFWLTCFGASGIALGTLGIGASSIQLYRYFSRSHPHRDWDSWYE